LRRGEIWREIVISLADLKWNLMSWCGVENQGHTKACLLRSPLMYASTFRAGKLAAFAGPWPPGHLDLKLPPDCAL